MDDFAESLTRRFLGFCENQRTQAAVIATIRLAMDGETGSQKVFRRLNRLVFLPLAGPAGLHVSTTRVQLALGTLSAAAMMRYVMKLEPLASMELEDLVRTLTPAVRGALQAEPSGEIEAWDAEVAPYPRAEPHRLDARRNWKLTGRLT
ncbi:hypothetical protein GCM10011584_24890 [Nocardioides phosphati]|uniref:Tetracyclin repressor-like C-terminal domain-containing protein n=1 Tax=Nocardioides phosphati TaxID=1867775 RepID=A0ABQ2NE35_9ACTN|nr:hypothetical protein [Nocardioides phosphati]GGO91252.1 hypothetical protein GCM10011584_24890 [Nocardioides phosphati]